MKDTLLARRKTLFCWQKCKQECNFGWLISYFAWSSWLYHENSFVKRHFLQLRTCFLFSRILDRLWSVEIGIPCDTDIEYRYFIASIDPQIGNDMVHVRKWETHLKPRHISKDSESQISTVETFGVVDGIEKVDRGWLTNETIVQFKFFNNPFHLKERVKNRLLYVKVIVRHGLPQPPHNRTNLFSWPPWICALTLNPLAWKTLQCRMTRARTRVISQVSWSWHRHHARHSWLFFSFSLCIFGSRNT